MKTIGNFDRHKEKGPSIPETLIYRKRFSYHAGFEREINELISA
jgi:hypothetical protein